MNTIFQITVSKPNMINKVIFLTNFKIYQFRLTINQGRLKIQTALVYC
ncbi:hypothetical protein l13_06460 [Neisseria weaveri ATCC 51223]|nr:hypothetical protein l13_06460 [Neisseria weaveri ATCC 51223]